MRPPLNRISDKPPECRQLGGIVEVLRFGDPKAFKTQDLAEGARHAVTARAMSQIDGNACTNQSPFVADGLEPGRAIDDINRCLEVTTKVFFSPNGQSFAIGPAGIRGVDYVVDIFIQHAFDASGVPGLSG